MCTVISDADCITPMETVCNAAAPSPDCQLILRQFFNDSGVFCINVSLTNDVSLAVASARVSVTVGGWKLNEPNTGKVSQYSAEAFLITLICFSFSFHRYACWNCSHSSGCHGPCMCGLHGWFDVQVRTWYHQLTSFSYSATTKCQSAGPHAHFFVPLLHS